MRHIATGGYWYNKKSRKWVSAGVDVVNYIQEHLKEARLLGLNYDMPAKIGTATLLVGNRDAQSHRSSRLPPIPWSETVSSAAVEVNGSQLLARATDSESHANVKEEPTDDVEMAEHNPPAPTLASRVFN